MNGLCGDKTLLEMAILILRSISKVVDAVVLNTNYLNDRPHDSGATNMLDVDAAVAHHSAASGVFVSSFMENGMRQEGDSSHDILLGSATNHFWSDRGQLAAEGRICC